MHDPMLKITIDDILENASLPDTPELRALLTSAYEAGALEGLAAPSAPGDPAAAEREAGEFAVAARLALNTGAMTPLRGVLDAHIARKSS
jgi:hypothetical protein